MSVYRDLEKIRPRLRWEGTYISDDDCKRLACELVKSEGVLQLKIAFGELRRNMVVTQTPGVGTGAADIVWLAANGCNNSFPNGDTSGIVTYRDALDGRYFLELDVLVIARVHMLQELINLCGQEVVVADAGWRGGGKFGR